MPHSSDGQHPNGFHRLSRRLLLGGVAASGALVGAARAAFSQDSTPDATAEPPPPIQSTTAGELPTSGGMRPGPVGQQPSLATASNPSDPAHMTCDKAGINADIEHLDIVEGVMQNPTGPWVVAWYEQTATLGELGNVVLAGHVDYWDVGPSVFFNLRNLVEGDPIVLTGEDGRTYRYATESVEIITIEDLTGGRLQELMGPTDTATLTIFTCGGQFDYVNGEYLSRTVVRAHLDQPPATPASTPES